MNIDVLDRVENRFNKLIRKSSELVVVQFQPFKAESINLICFRFFLFLESYLVRSSNVGVGIWEIRLLSSQRFWRWSPNSSKSPSANLIQHFKRINDTKKITHEETLLSFRWRVLSWWSGRREAVGNRLILFDCRDSDCSCSVIGLISVKHRFKYVFANLQGHKRLHRESCWSCCSRASVMWHGASLSKTIGFKIVRGITFKETGTKLFNFVVVEVKCVQLVHSWKSNMFFPFKTVFYVMQFNRWFTFDDHVLPGS